MKARAGLIGCLSSLFVACMPFEGLDLDEDDAAETGGGPGHSSRLPVRDEWREELILPASGLRRLVIGGPLTHDNFSNRGDIEIRHEEGIDEVRIELQRFTVASNQENAEKAFDHMTLWAYALEAVEKPSDEIDPFACSVGQGDFCHIRIYYDGLFQPVRDGANIRVTLPRGWDGTLALETTDNLEGGEAYLDRGDVIVDGLAGNLEILLDSGRVQVRLDPAYSHYPGCPNDEACVAADFAPDCGCTEFGSIRVEVRSGQAADILVDVPVDHYYSANLENDDLDLDLGCVVDIDCESFPDCVLDPDGERGSINYPGPPAVEGTGIHIDLHSGACSLVEHADSPDDYEAPAIDVRGSVRLCSACWTGG